MRLKFFLSFTLVVLVAITSVLLIASQRAVSEVRMFMGGSMMEFDQLTGELEAYYGMNGSWQGVDGLLQAASIQAGNGMGGMMGSGPRLILADVDGRVVATSRGQNHSMLSSAEQAAAVRLKDSRGQEIGFLLAEGGQGNPAAESQLLSRLMWAGMLGAAVSLILALLLALFLSYSLLKPIQELTRAAARMSSGDLGQRVNDRGRDEIGQLGKAFNQMAESLQKAENTRRAMTADIAHELRTPIAIQRAHLEALQDGIYPLLVENLQPVLSQTELLTRLVEDLRTLALADAGELRLERVQVDLERIIRQTVERFRPETENHQIQMLVRLPTGSKIPSVRMDPGRIEQILNNLISNALRHTPENGEVCVDLEIQPGWFELRIADSGPGISDEALPRLFERFYRADSSRSRDAGGTGLGLAIARQLTLAQGGEIFVSNRPEGGAVFTLRFPLESS